MYADGRHIFYRSPTNKKICSLSVLNQASVRVKVMLYPKIADALWCSLINGIHPRNSSETDSCALLNNILVYFLEWRGCQRTLGAHTVSHDASDFVVLALWI